jgi:hypothetical protein
MAIKTVTMDKHGTFGPAEAASIDLTISIPSRPVNGFKWVKGLRSSAGSMVESVFLVPRSGSYTEVEMPKDLHLRFAELAPDKEGILSFAQQYGPLRYIGSHFHPVGQQRWKEGEELSGWQLEIRRFKIVHDLWFSAKSLKGLSITRKLLEQIPKRKTAEPWVVVVPEFASENSPQQVAKEIVVTTINAGLTPGFEQGNWDCLFPGCGARGPGARPFHDYTRAFLRASKLGLPDVVVVPTNLIKALWLQCASMVAGQRRVTKCEAPDCGRYMDVTTSPHPGACRMHSWCAERWRKRRYREKQRNNDKK